MKVAKAANMQEFIQQMSIGHKDSLLHTNGSFQEQSPATTSPGLCREVLLDSWMHRAPFPKPVGTSLGLSSTVKPQELCTMRGRVENVSRIRIVPIDKHLLNTPQSDLRLAECTGKRGGIFSPVAHWRQGHQRRHCCQSI